MDAPTTKSRELSKTFLSDQNKGKVFAVITSTEQCNESPISAIRGRGEVQALEGRK